MRAFLSVLLICLSTLSSFAQSNVLIGYWWISRVNEDAEVGTYAPVPVNGAYYYTDLRALLPSGTGVGGFYRNLHLPTWWPRKTLLAGIHYEFGYGGVTPQQVNITAYVDVKGKGYLTGTPPGAEVGSNFTRDIHLAGQIFFTEPSAVNYTLNQGNPIWFPVPVAFDRDAGDHIVLSVSNNIQLDWIAAKFYFIAPSTITPVAPGSGY